jgi:hypothetical protein
MSSPTVEPRDGAPRLAIAVRERRDPDVGAVGGSVQNRPGSWEWHGVEVGPDVRV